MTQSTIAFSVAAPARVRWRSSSGFHGSAFVWAGVMAYVVVAKVLLESLPNAFSDPTQKALFSWQGLGVIGLLGLIGVFLSHRTGFPAAWDPRLGTRQRLVVPAMLGLAFAAVLIGFDLVTGYTRLAASQFGLERQFTDYPQMFLIFTAGSAIFGVAGKCRFSGSWRS